MQTSSEGIMPLEKLIFHWSSVKHLDVTWVCCFYWVRVGLISLTSSIWLMSTATDVSLGPIRYKSLVDQRAIAHSKMASTFIRLLYCLTILGWFQIHCYVSVPVIYRKVDDALRRYASTADFNPLVHSLLNVLVYDKRAEAFISGQAIELCLKEIGKCNQEDELLLRQMIDGRTSTLKKNPPSPELKEQITSTLDRFFMHSNLDDYEALKAFEQ